LNPIQAAEKYHWIKYDASTNTIDIFCDHQMLSTLRTCESKFVLEHLLNIRPKGHKAWSLVFGAWMHYCLEFFYNSIKNDPNGSPVNVNTYAAYGAEKWRELNLNAYKGGTKYEDIAGWNGALALLIEYYAFYMQQRLRVVACEIPFGMNREVPLGQFYLQNVRPVFDPLGPDLIVRCFLTGRIDMLVDNGSIIGPVDHKHTHVFRGDEYDKFNPHDGILGYIYATNKIIETYFPGYNKPCMAGWVFHIQGKAPSVERKTKILRPRFKGSRIDKTPRQLDDFAARQLSSFKRVAELLFQDKNPEWSTHACPNIYGRPCEYREIHRQDSEYWPHAIEQFYHITEAWNPNKPEESLIVRDDVMNAVAAEPVEVDNG
jgi:hypothetical protein